MMHAPRGSVVGPNVFAQSWLLFASFTSLTSLAGCAAAVDDDESVVAQDQALVFGGDDRLEYGAASSGFQRWADSTAVAATPDTVTCINGTCTIHTKPWARDTESGMNLCNTVRYFMQPRITFDDTKMSSGFCTVFLVAPNMVAGAAHCFADTGTASLSVTKFVFGYKVNANGTIPTTVPESEVYGYGGASSFSTDPNDDWALIKLDRAVSNHPPLYVRHSASVALNKPLAIIGNPNGLPIKVSPTGNVTDTSSSFAFGHNVDSFEGNSGSPVFDRSTGTVEGIHVRPPTGFSHFVPNPPNNTCVIERTCATTGCGGAYSQASRITRLQNLIPLTPGITSVATNLVNLL
jgi:V8-like Glu-specific endopeptidase